MAATTDALLAFIAAAALAWLLVPYVERLAFRVGVRTLRRARTVRLRPAGAPGARVRIR